MKNRKHKTLCVYFETNKVNLHNSMYYSRRFFLTFNTVYGLVPIEKKESGLDYVNFPNIDEHYYAHRIDSDI